MIWICRVLLLISYAIFWGGLTFYTGIAVRVSHDVLSNSMDGGLITQRVTQWLQVLGGVTVACMFWNAIAVGSVLRRYGYLLATLAVVVGASIIGLAAVHGQLDAVIDVASREVTDREAFSAGHRHYNQLTTLEWLASLGYLLTTIRAWRQVDKQLGTETA